MLTQRSLDLIGLRKGRITILSFKEQRNNRSFYWNYGCDCGNFGVISTSEFNRSRSTLKSCGCWMPKQDLTNLKFPNSLMSIKAQFKISTQGKHGSTFNTA